MKIQECYEKLGGDFSDILKRVIREATVSKFLLMYLSDESFKSFHTAWDAQNMEDAFRAAHTLKGTALNLSITNLVKVASVVTESLRPGVAPDHDISDEIAALDAEQERTIAIIKEYQENRED